MENEEGKEGRAENEGKEELRTILEDLLGAMGRCRSYLRESELLPQFIDSELRIRVFFVFSPLIALSIALLVKYNPFCIFFFFWSCRNNKNTSEAYASSTDVLKAHRKHALDTLQL